MLLRMIIGLATAVSCASAAAHSNNGGQPIIIDTDLMTDVDDAGALAVANVLHNCGLTDLRGIAINTQSRYGALAASSICTYYGNGHIPIAAMRPLTNESFFDTYGFILGEFASKIAHNWPRRVQDAESTPTPVEMYRSVLNSASNKSMHLISIGFLTNLAELLRSQPDSIADMTGSELVSAKVSELVVMGGRYPSGWGYNFGGVDPESTAYVLQHWPRDVPVTYSGGELGGSIYSGQTLQQDAPCDSPVLAAYLWYVGRCSTIRKSWDPLTTLYGVLGLDGFEGIGVEPPLAFANQYGYNSITSSNGSNAWVNDTSVTNQHWLRLSDGVTNTSVASLLNYFYTQNPDKRTCAGSSSIEGLVEQT